MFATFAGSYLRPAAVPAALGAYRPIVASVGRTGSAMTKAPATESRARMTFRNRLAFLATASARWPQRVSAAVVPG